MVAKIEPPRHFYLFCGRMIVDIDLVANSLEQMALFGLQPLSGPQRRDFVLFIDHYFRGGLTDDEMLHL